MFDEQDRLCTDPDLFTLLTHYATLSLPDREAWQDRLMRLGDGPGKDLVRMYGELLAYGWIEQNTGVVAPGPPGTVARCYRITPAGQKALKRVRTERAFEDEDAAAA